MTLEWKCFFLLEIFFNLTDWENFAVLFLIFWEHWTLSKEHCAICSNQSKFIFHQTTEKWLGHRTLCNGFANKSYSVHFFKLFFLLSISKCIYKVILISTLCHLYIYFLNYLSLLNINVMPYKCDVLEKKKLSLCISLFNIFILKTKCYII